MSATPADNEIENRRLPGMLASVFDRMRKDNIDSGKAQEKIIEEFSSRVNHAFDQAHQDSKEREQILEERIRAMEQEQGYKLQRVRILSIPATVIALACLVYLFYMVNVMERSMTSMSDNIGQMRGSMQDISGDTRSMAKNVSSMNSEMSHMNGNINHLNQNVGVMGRDVGAMSHSVSPMMNGMRSFMPF
jgi:uncharacterized protein YoxC